MLLWWWACPRTPIESSPIFRYHYRVNRRRHQFVMAICRTLAQRRPANLASNLDVVMWPFCCQKWRPPNVKRRRFCKRHVANVHRIKSVTNLIDRFVCSPTSFLFMRLLYNKRIVYVFGLGFLLLSMCVFLFCCSCRDSQWHVLM